MRVVVPMAGRGSRLKDANADLPKPLIPVAGRPMVEWALKSLTGIDRSEIIFVALEEHERRHNISGLLKSFVDDPLQVVLLPDVTEGQLCTVLEARNRIDPDEDLLVVACDTYVVSELGRDIEQLPDGVEGIISVAKLPGDHWSFARVDDRGHVLEVAEKKRVSDYASTGLYYFADAGRFLATADEIVARRETVRGEYYVIPVYQKYIDSGSPVTISVASAVWDLGSPDSLKAFEAAF